MKFICDIRKSNSFWDGTWERESDREKIPRNRMNSLWILLISCFLLFSFSGCCYRSFWRWNYGSIRKWVSISFIIYRSFFSFFVSLLIVVKIVNLYTVIHVVYNISAIYNIDWMLKEKTQIYVIFNVFSWQKESKFLFNQVRLPPDEPAVTPVFTEGMEVEVFSRSNEREACGWWCADIKVSFW